MNKLNEFINSTKGRFLGVTLENTKRTENFSAKVVGQTEQYVTLTGFTYDEVSGRKFASTVKVKKNSIKSMTSGEMQYSR